jgi:hypothetical protein
MSCEICPIYKTTNILLHRHEKVHKDMYVESVIPSLPQQILSPLKQTEDQGPGIPSSLYAWQQLCNEFSVCLVQKMSTREGKNFVNYHIVLF